jgi:fructokinase
VEDKADSTNGLIKRPVIFGEVLFDCFPDGNSVLGGAPFNVAWHLKGLGQAPLFLSRVGNDANGDTVRGRMHSWGMDLAGLQLDQQHPTGQVTIELDEGQPTFDIVADQAYDYIETEAALNALKTCDPILLYYGSLISRSEVSRNSLLRIRESSVPSYVDINLRKPWWNDTIIDEALQNARWVKLNDDEVKVVTGLNDIVAGARKLVEQYALEWVIVTRGAQGAFIASADGIIETEPVTVDEITDTVGAGDAFSAVTLLGIIDHWSLEEILQRAAQFAAAICTMRGATVNDQRFYDNFIGQWTNE